MVGQKPRRASRESGEDFSEMTQREKDEALWDAAEAGDEKLVEKLKVAGGSVSWFHPQKPPGRAYQFTALHIASDKGHLPVVKYLVEKAGADLDLKSKCAHCPIAHPKLCPLAPTAYYSPVCDIAFVFTWRDRIIPLWQTERPQSSTSTGARPGRMCTPFSRSKEA